MYIVKIMFMIAERVRCAETRILIHTKLSIFKDQRKLIHAKITMFTVCLTCKGDAPGHHFPEHQTHGVHIDRQEVLRVEVIYSTLQHLRGHVH